MEVLLSDLKKKILRSENVIKKNTRTSTNNSETIKHWLLDGERNNKNCTNIFSFSSHMGS